MFSYAVVGRENKIHSKCVKIKFYLVAHYSPALYCSFMSMKYFVFIDFPEIKKQKNKNQKENQFNYNFKEHFPSECKGLTIQLANGYQPMAKENFKQRL